MHIWKPNKYKNPTFMFGAQAEFGATGRGCSPPTTVIVSITKHYRKALHYEYAVRVGRYDRTSAFGSRLARNRQRYNMASAPESIQTCIPCAGDAINLTSSTRNRTSLLPCFLCYLTSIPF
ncbi:hypothetical protein Zmor_012440 [Zophobas morio]|uniref:Uncharacterized protein n=1 Tax=Zophobas morio TaxID=2755281 RepID=A0AA38IDF7_9CUCU|nr:hypothetical protein Zmor_012440 [Zophobas morio]